MAVMSQGLAMGGGGRQNKWGGYSGVGRGAKGVHIHCIRITQRRKYTKNVCKAMNRNESEEF